MDTNSIIKLLSNISIAYPSFKKQISTDDGKIRKAVVEEWYNRVGFMSYDDANKIFEKYVLSDGSRYAPNWPDFLKAKATAKTVSGFFDGARHVYHVGLHGELLDEEDREYGNPLDYETPYRYDEMTGHIVQGNRLVQ